MRRRYIIGAILDAVFEPVIDGENPVFTSSRSVGEAIARLDHQADKLLEEVRGEDPFHETLLEITEKMR